MRISTLNSFLREQDRMASEVMGLPIPRRGQPPVVLPPRSAEPVRRVIAQGPNGQRLVARG